MNPTIAPEGLSITEALSALEPKGYTGQFVPRVADESITMRCTTCNELYDPSLLQTGDVLRVEGPSEPDEMAVVIGATCPKCGAKGTLTLSYGPTASVEDSAVLDALPDLAEGDRTPTAL